MSLLCFGTAVRAEGPWAGTWVERHPPEQGAAAAKVTMTMVVQESGATKTIRYRFSGEGAPPGEMTVVSRFDGADAPLLHEGKPSGETMAIKLTDSRHSLTTIKFNGEKIGTSRAELSADGKVLTTVDEYLPGSPMGESKLTHVWDKQR